MTSIALALIFLSLEVARAYQGPVLSFGPVSAASNTRIRRSGSPSAPFSCLSASRSARSRPASLRRLLLLTVAKVFVVDMDALTEVWWALSFVGPGRVLVGIGYLYQRLLFPRRAVATILP